MGTEDLNITEIRQPEELPAFIKDNEISIVMTDKEAELLLGYLEGHDYVVGFAGGKLYRGDMAEIPGEIIWEDFSVDDLIDTVCEWNYELILDMEAEMQNPDNKVDFSGRQDKYESLKQEEVILDKLFERTKYGLVIERTAEELFGDLLKNLKDKGIDRSVETLVSGIRQSSISGKAR